MPSDDSAVPSDPSGGLDELFAALAHDRRRHVLRYFLEENEVAAELDELAERIAGRDGASDDAATVAIDLHHADLPKLEEVGVVEYDARSKVARYRGGDRIETFWETVASDESNRETSTRE